MKLQLLAVGTKMPAWVQTGYGEYVKRMPREMSPKLVEIAPAHRAKNTAKIAAITAEGDAILAAIDKHDFVVALEVKGHHWSTEQLASKIDDWRMLGRPLTFVVGGPDGLCHKVLVRADAKWSLSSLTLPHPLVRVIWAEQLYRAWTLLSGHPYHK